MANSNGTQHTRPVWYRLAQPGDHLRALWGQGVDRTRWVACGRTWDAVAITPMTLGLQALVAMRVGPRRGYPVLADHLCDQLYVLVPRPARDPRPPVFPACASSAPGSSS